MNFKRYGKIHTKVIILVGFAVGCLEGGWRDCPGDLNWSALFPLSWKRRCLLYVFVVQLLSRVRLFGTPWTAAQQASLSFTISQSLLILLSIEFMMLCNYRSLCNPLLLPSIFLSLRVFSNESALHIRWPKFCSFSFSISPSKEYSGLISFRIEWFDLAVQGTLKSLLQHPISKASMLWHLAFFMVQLSHPDMTAGKNHSFD